MRPLVLRIIVRTEVSHDHTSLYCCLFVLILDFIVLHSTELRVRDILLETEHVIQFVSYAECKGRLPMGMQCYLDFSFACIGLARFYLNLFTSY